MHFPRNSYVPSGKAYDSLHISAMWGSVHEYVELCGVNGAFPNTHTLSTSQ